jgi:asparagine synthase (glutamine-hydrolysing)
MQTGFEEAAGEVARALDASVAGAVRGRRLVAVAFSGGLDSSVVAKCAMGRAEVIACSGFAAGSRDSGSASVAARALGVDLRVADLTAEGARADLASMDLPFQPTLMDKGLWCLYTAVAREAARAGADVLLLGQLADELFGGYAKYVEALAKSGEAAAASEMDRDLDGYFARGMARDVAACSRFVEPGLPFAAPEVVSLGRGLPVAFKIRDGVRKAVLREAAAALGVPAELAGAAKKAAQYSSGVQKLLRQPPF